MTEAPVRPAVPRHGGGGHDPGPGSTSVAAGADTAGPGAHRTVAAGTAGRDARWPWAAALAVYSAAVVLVVAWPSPVDAGAQDSFTSFFRRLHAAGVPDWVGYAALEAGANVAMFVPLGFLVTRLGSRWWWGLVVPAALSVVAEIGQALMRPERFATASDVAANAGGAAIGTVVALLLTARGRSARRATATRRARTRRRAR